MDLSDIFKRFDDLLNIISIFHELDMPSKSSKPINKLRNIMLEHGFLTLPESVAIHGGYYII